jgi:putative SOS response-associated peptidase YedK
MCGRFSFAFNEKIIVEILDIDLEDEEYIPRYNCAPSQKLAVITGDTPRRLSYFKWGLVPSWAKDISIGNKMINAKAETIFEKPAFKNAIKSRRCLVPADSFYEWKQDKNNAPYRVLLKNESPLVMAGIWETWKDAEGKPLQTFSIITTKANSMMQDLHNRMPVIVDISNKTKWLSSESSDEINSLLKPFSSDLMKSYPVSKLVNSPKNDTAEIHKSL